jgi:23S rRNA pseudouridine1911/1915/1917 synthase
VAGWGRRGGGHRSPADDGRSLIRLHILYEDRALIFIDKPSGLVVQRRMFEPTEPFLHDLVQRHTSPAFLMQRLDRGTSGVIFFSKLADINARLTRQFERKRIRKTYLTICEGELAERQAGSVVEIALETGRTHQIRVHLSAARPMLHAAELEMMHPLTGQILRVAAPIPDDFREEAERRGLRASAGAASC